MAGTGSEGRITKDDVLRHLSAARPRQRWPKAAVERSCAAAAPSWPAAGGADDQDARHHCPAHGGEHAISPHVHTVYKVDMTRIVRMREREKAGFEQQQRRQAHLYAVYRRGGG